MSEKRQAQPRDARGRWWSPPVVWLRVRRWHGPQRVKRLVLRRDEAGA